MDDLREAAATFGDVEPIDVELLDGWEARRRELAAFYAVNDRRPRRRAMNPGERRLAAWVERQANAHRSPRRARNLILLQLTPGWKGGSSRSPSSNRRSTYIPFP